ncbi:YgcG family protein [Microbacterium paludicola]|uniref:TPM domain-containing protein n=1 Tax=Microbacterium paludicola TaxID=300019 RepID=UPI0011A8BA9A|nr:TPM domain-containing protein [Microbacterium paludicola]
MRARFTVMVGVIAAMFASVSFASVAAATEPVTLDSGFVTDEAGVLSSGEVDAVNARLSALGEDDGGDLYVVFVDEFTAPSSSVDWADQTAIQNGLATDQYLVAVAVDAGQYAISADTEGPLSDAEIDRVVQAMENGLRAGDWDRAVIDAADAFPGQGDSGGGAVWIVVLVIAAAVVLIIVLVTRSKRKKKRTAVSTPPDPSDPYATVSDDELATRAGSALVNADDAITSSRQEVGFAIAQYGDDSAETFTKVVEAAQAKVAEAFSLKQKIDDDIPDTAEQRRAWHIQIIELCDEADDLLNDNIEAFEELRRLEADAPKALDRLRARRATAEQTLATADPALAALADTYDAAAIAPVADNPEQARRRLSLADGEIAEAEAAISRGDNGEAAFSIRTAEEAVEQSEQLVDAVTSLGAGLAAVSEQAQAAIIDLEADIAAASAMPDDQGRLTSVVARTRATIDAARERLGGASRNPQQVLDSLEQINTEMDALLGQAREAAQQAERAQRTLQQRLTQAQAQINAANDFITTRRGAIGATARTRLAEANAVYADAVAAQDTDVARATERAIRAHGLASDALTSARSEVNVFSTGGPTVVYGGGYRRDSDLSGDILGGILGGLFSGGGGGGGGGGWSSGSSSWRSSGSSRSSRSTRSSRPSSFGGGSSRSSSRSGGRSRGGRF